MAFDGASRAWRDASGDLLIETAAGVLRQLKPVAYQLVSGRRRMVDAEYVVAGTVARFALGEFDRSVPLVIDPVLLTSTYLGGSGDESDTDVAFGSDALYVAGTTLSTDFPTAGPETSLRMCS